MNLELTTLAPTAADDGSPLTMSSREIAELTGSTHDNVLKTVRRLIGEGVVSGNETPYTHPQNGRTYTEFHLDYRNTMVVVSGYSVELRAKIIDRWMELEQLQQAPSLVFDPADPKVMLAVFDHLQSQVKERDAVIAVQGEKVKLLDRLEAAEGSMCLRDAAKTLGVRPKDLNVFLSTRRWIYKRPGNGAWIAYQDKIQAGLLEHIDHHFVDDQDRERIATRAVVTAKGLVKLAELLERPLH